MCGPKGKKKKTNKQTNKKQIKKTSAKFGVLKNWFFVQFEAFETETWPNVRHKNWTFLQFWAFEMQIFQKFVISSKCTEDLEELKNSEMAVLGKGQEGVKEGS